ncbi:MAG TPA: EAL domain-containing protein [Rubrivivax sp.]|jgi:diguanylate cyclase (GGDEF)-like protein|nr:EAL domain-containing protein [Rubrivivax sp.]
MSLLQSFDNLDLAGLVSEAGEAIVFVDKNWTARYCNDVYAKNLGLSVDQVVGRTPFEYVPLFKRSIFYEATEHCLVNRTAVSKIGFSTVLNRWLMVRVFPVADGMLMLANDASESVVKAYNLAQQAVKDPLTGLGNKLAMEQKANQLVNKGETFSIVVVGLHRFRDINDSHGYATGDMALLEVASHIQTATLSGETLYRISGDEFALIREGESDGAAERALAFIDAVKTPMILSGIRIVLGSCVGTVQSPADGGDYEVLLKRAGLALRDAKKGGRDTIASFRSDLELASKMRSVIESELRVALDGSQFSLMIQPKVSLATGAVVGGEALIRWAHPKRGLLAPGVFLGIAQDMGAMQTIDQWVLRQALKYCSQLCAKGLKIPISINLSVDSLTDLYLVHRVSEALEDANVPSRLLEIEIPEGAIMHDVSASGKVLAALHEMGVRISIDDFGTGYSSFAYLAQFPVHSLKIDRSFVAEIVSSETSRKIVKGIVRLAHSLSLEVVAEGAETEAQVSLLRRMKCDALQGYVIAKPLPWSDFKQFVASRPAVIAPDPMAI